MGQDARLFIFAYDVTDDRRRARVAHLLEQDAARVQDSLFEAMLRPALADQLADKVKRLLLPGDRLRVYSVPRHEIDRIVAYGGAPVQQGEDYWLL